MALKRKAIPLPDLKGKTVLDIGCDHGWWCWEAERLGAKSILGLDRNRHVHGKLTDLVGLNSAKAKESNSLCEFRKIDLGLQWHEFGKHDVTFCFSMYHHVFQNCANHKAIWFWLWRHTEEMLLWENPVSIADSVVRLNVSRPYNADEILSAAEKYFQIEHIGLALHEPTREVWRCWPRRIDEKKSEAVMKRGSGGASRAFTHVNNRRINEIETILGFRPLPGSLNAKAKFDWNSGYYRGKVLDVLDRKKGLDGEWGLRWARFYPVKANDVQSHAFRFEGENYGDDFVELIADRQLRDVLPERFEIRQ